MNTKIECPNCQQHLEIEQPSAAASYPASLGIPEESIKAWRAADSAASSLSFFAALILVAGVILACLPASNAISVGIGSVISAVVLYAVGRLCAIHAELIRIRCK